MLDSIFLLLSILIFLDHEVAISFRENSGFKKPKICV